MIIYQLPNYETTKTVLDAAMNDNWLSERIAPTVAKYLAGRALSESGIKLEINLSMHDAFKDMGDSNNPALLILPMFIDDWTGALIAVSEQNEEREL